MPIPLPRNPIDGSDTNTSAFPWTFGICMQEISWRSYARNIAPAMMVVKGAETLNIDGIRVPTDITREDQLLCLFRNRVTAFLCTLN